jgi:single-stranded-DNA-specific exonuclease
MRNAERQSIERRLARELRDVLGASFDPERDAVIVEFREGWHRGVLGIAASRLAREYRRPVLLFAVEGERAFGSGRSIPGVPLHDTLKEMSQFFTEFGGHDQAVGGSLPASRLPEMREAARALFAERIPRERFQHIEEAEAELPVESVDEELWRCLSQLEPHGVGNGRPVFSSQMAPLRKFRELGESGQRGRLRHSGGELDGICWRPELRGLLSSGQPFVGHYRLGRNRAGRLEVEIVAAHSCNDGLRDAGASDRSVTLEKVG